RLNLEPLMRAQAVAVVEAYVVDREVEADGVVEAYDPQDGGRGGRALLTTNAQVGNAEMVAFAEQQPATKLGCALGVIEAERGQIGAVGSPIGREEPATSAEIGLNAECRSIRRSQNACEPEHRRPHPFSASAPETISMSS